jgi:hypothetical protein
MEDPKMTHPNPRFRSTAWFLLIGLAVVLAGCGNDKMSPIDSELPDDGAPPATPIGLHTLSQDGSKISFAWTPNGELDIVGYRIYVYQPDPDREQAYLPMNDAPITRTRMTLTGQAGVSYFVRVTAVDALGNESGMSLPLSIVYGDTGTTLPYEQGQEGTRPGDYTDGGNGHSNPYNAGDLPNGK